MCGVWLYIAALRAVECLERWCLKYTRVVKGQLLFQSG